MNFLGTFSKYPKISNFVKIHPVGAELFRADGQTDMTKLTVSLHNSANAPKQQKNNRRAEFYISDQNVSNGRFRFLSSADNNKLYVILLLLLLLLLYLLLLLLLSGDRGGTVVKVLCYKSEGRWFDPSWCQWNFSLT